MNEHDGHLNHERRDPAKVNAGLAEVRTLMRSQKLWEAEKKVAELRGLSPDDPRPDYILCEILLRKGSLQEAMELARAGLEKHPSSPEFHRLEIRGLLDGGKNEEAFAKTEAMLALQELDADLAFLRCRALMGLKRYAELEELAAKALASYDGDRRFQPLYARAHYLTVRALVENGKYAEALWKTEGSVTGEAPDADLALLRCRALLALKRFKEVERLAADAAEAHPEDLRFAPLFARALHSEVRALVEAGKFAEAVERTEDSVQKGYLDAELAGLRCRALIGLGRRDEAEALADSAGREFADTARFAQLRARVLFELGRFEEAAETAKQALAEKPDDSALLVLHCRALFELKRHEEAEQVALKGLEANPDAEELVLWRCRSLFELGRQADVAEAAEAGLARWPDDLRLSLLLSRALLELGRFEEAAARAAAILERTPQDATALTVRGRALFALGRSKEFCSEAAPPEVSDDKNLLPLVTIYARSLESACEWDRITTWLEPHFQSGRALPLSAQEALSSAYQHLGRHDDAKGIYRRLVATTWNITLPHDLADGLMKRAIDFAPRTIPNSKMTPAVVDKLWSLADQNRWTRNEWIDRMRWGMGAQTLLRNIVMTQSPLLDQIIEQVDLEKWQDFETHILKGNSVIATGGHVGAHPAILATLIYRNIPTCVLSKYTIPDELIPKNFIFITATQDPRSTVRGIQKAVAEGRVIIVGGDNENDLETTDNGYAFLLFGQNVVAPSVPSRLAYQHKLPTIWIDALFSGNRICIKPETMLDAPRAETKDDFAVRWWESYIDRMLPILSRDPANLYMESGLIRRALLESHHPVHGARKLDLAVGWESALSVRPTI